MSSIHDDLADRLLRLDVLERHAEKGTLLSLLVHLEGVREELAGDPRAGVCAVLAAALRLDLAFLTEHPEAMFSALYNRCFWHASERTGELPTDADEPLLDLLERWRAERAARGAVWARSLRPPELGLGARWWRSTAAWPRSTSSGSGSSTMRGSSSSCTAR